MHLKALPTIKVYEISSHFSTYSQGCPYFSSEIYLGWYGKELFSGHWPLGKCMIQEEMKLFPSFLLAARREPWLLVCHATTGGHALSDTQLFPPLISRPTFTALVGLC